jgi:hypothetical protein
MTSPGELKQNAREGSSEHRHDRDNSLDRDEELPTYHESLPESSVLHPHPTSASTAGASTASTIGPTISSPFNFPITDQAPPPDYSSPTSTQRPIAIPQRFSGPTAPFLSAYPPLLTTYGIPASSWYSFLDTMSAFLTAKVSKRAVSHAGDIAASVGRVPKRLGKDIANHVKDTFKEIGHQAKSRNVLGVVGGIIGGSIALTVGTAARTVGSAMSLPGTAIGTGVNPKTPRERAEAYAAAANKDWFHKRALHARLLNTAELAILVGVTTKRILDTINSQSISATRQMEAMRDLVEGVDLREDKQPDRENAPALSPAGFPVDIKQTPLPEEYVTAGSSEGSSSRVKQPDKQEKSTSLHISAETLWLVVLRDTPQSSSTK